jgi:sulfur carrier protein
VNLVVNGKKREVPDGTTVSDLVAELGLRARNVVVELNRNPLDRGSYTTQLNPGDVIEIVRAVAGG